MIGKSLNLSFARNLRTRLRPLLLVGVLLVSQLTFVPTVFATGSSVSGIAKFQHDTTDYFATTDNSYYVQIFNGTFSGLSHPDALGAYSVGGVPDGTYRVRVNNPGADNMPKLDNLTSLNYPVGVSGSSVTRDVTFDLSNVSVTVLGPDGNPADNLAVSMSSIGYSQFTDTSGTIQFETSYAINNGKISNSATTGPNGVGVIPILTNVYYSICAAYNGKQYCAPRQTVSDDTNVQINIPNTNVSGVVKYSDGANDIFFDTNVNNNIQIYNNDFSGTSTPDSAGNYSMSNVPDGSFNTRIWTSGSSNGYGVKLPSLSNLSSSNSPFVVNGSDLTKDVVIRLSYVTITVKDANGNLVEGASVNLSSKGQSVFTDSSGSIEFSTPTTYNNGVIGNGASTNVSGVAVVPILTDVNYSICASYNSVQKCLDNQIVSSDITDEIVFAEANTSGVMKFQDSSNTYYADTTTSPSKPYVQIFNDVFSGISNTDTSGNYTVGNMPNGSYRVRVFTPSSNNDQLPRIENLTSTNSPVSISDQNDAIQDITFDLANTEVTVKDLDGNKVSNTSVSATSIGQSTFTDSSGIIQFETPAVTNNGMISNGGNTDSNGETSFALLSGVYYSICAVINGNTYCANNQTISQDTSITIQAVPDAPMNLSASSPTNNPYLTWNAANGATSYKVYRDGTYLETVTATNHIDSGVTEGTHDYYVTAVNAGGESDPSNTISILVDKTDPDITYTLSPAANTNGWNNSNVTVTFNCSDTSSGISSCTNPVTVTTEGESQIATGTAVDNAGNSTTINATINLDKTNPTINYSSSSTPNANGWYGSNVTVTFTCADELSGISSCTSPITVSTEGANQTVTGTAVDNAGNTVSTSVDISLDKTNPAITYTLTPAPNTDGWNNSDVTVTFSCSDALSGIDTCLGSTTLTNEGANQTVTGSAVDNAGNSVSVTATISIDKTNPTVTNVQVNPNVVIKNTNPFFVVSANAADQLSGVKYVEYYIDTDPGQGNGTQMSYSGGNASASGNAASLSTGQHTVYVRVQDSAGNWSTSSSTGFVVAGLPF